MIDAPRSRPDGLRTIALALLACALALRLLIPAGWMPVHDAQGFHLTLCSGTGPEPLPAHAAMAGMAHHGTHRHDHQHDQGMPDHPCAFAGLGMVLAEPVLPAVAPIVATVEPAIVAIPAAVAIGRGLAAPPPPPTGPPALG